MAGDGYWGSIVVLNGVPNSPLNRYNQVKNVDIQNNTIINYGSISFGEGKYSEKTLAPINTNFSSNIIYNSNPSKNIVFVDNAAGISFNTNYLDTPTTEVLNGFKTSKLDWKELGAFRISTANNSDLLAVTKKAKSFDKDIRNAVRKVFNAGDFNLD